MNTKLVCRGLPCLAMSILVGTVQAVGQEGPVLPAQEKKLLELTNAQRIQKKLAPVQASPLLFQVARAHAQNMAKQGKLEHVLDGKNPLDRLRDAGYKFSAMGENVGRMGPKVPVETLMKMWMESKIHRDNILNPDVTEVGLGLASDVNGQVYYAQVFGKQR